MGNKAMIIDIKYILFIVSLLILPAKNQYIYIIGLGAIIYFFVGELKTRYNFNSFSKIISIFIIYVLFTAALRFCMDFNPNIRDFFEAFRFIPLFLLVFLKKNLASLSKFHFIASFFIFVSVDFFISILQFTKINFLGLIDFVGLIYNNDGQFERSFLNTNRIMGITPNPNDHATFMLVALGTFLGFLRYKIKLKEKALCIIGSSFAVVGILLSQSRVGLITLGVVILGYSFFILLYGKTVSRIIIMSVLFCISIWLLYYIEEIFMFLDNFRYLLDFFQNGLEANSYQLRLVKWEHFYLDVMDNPVLFLIGAGKDFFGISSGAMDSDYVYIMLIYGIFVFLLFFFLVLKIYLELLVGLKTECNCFVMPLFLWLTVGLFISITGAFFINPQIQCILVLYVIKYLDYKEGD